MENVARGLRGPYAGLSQDRASPGYSMTEPPPKLSPRSFAVLEMIAAGSTYEQILSAYPDFTYLDIFRAAEEALELGLRVVGPKQTAYTVAEKRDRYPRAYEKWTDDDDGQLRQLVHAGS